MRRGRGGCLINGMPLDLIAIAMQKCAGWKSYYQSVAVASDLIGGSLWLVS